MKILGAFVRKLLFIVILTFFLLPSTRETLSSQESVREIPREAEKHYQKGSEYFFAENLIAAYKEYSEAIKSYDGYFWAYLSRGYTLTKLNRFKEAEEDYSKAIELDSKSVDAFICRGLIRKELKDYQGALQDFSSAIQIKPSFPDSYNNRGIIKNAIKDYQGAIQDFSSAIEIDDRFGEAYFNRGTAKYNLNEKVEACDDWQSSYNYGVQESFKMIQQYCQ
jgi:tetratricopeptide (TPR) repeat protein